MIAVIVIIIICLAYILGSTCRKRLSGRDYKKMAADDALRKMYGQYRAEVQALVQAQMLEASADEEWLDGIKGRAAASTPKWRFSEAVSWRLKRIALLLRAQFRAARPARSLGMILAHLRAWVRAHAKGLGVLSAATTSIAVAGVTSGVVGIVVVGGFVLSAGWLLLISIPVAGFTRNQAALAKKGEDIATNTAEVCALMDSHAAAYDVIFRRLPSAGPFRRDLHAPQQAPKLPGAPARRPARRPDVTPGWPRRHQPGRDTLPAGADARMSRRPGVSFWQLLTLDEQRSLSASGQMVTFKTGSVICRQGERADHILLIMSGWTRVFTEHEDGITVIAERGPGDLIGERAVMMVRWMSASVVALDDVQALRVPEEGFATFLRVYPRANALLEHQVYQRLTEDRDGTGPDARAASWTGQICPIVLTDITAFGSSSRNDTDRLKLRKLTNDLMPEAFAAASLSWRDCYTEDRGDGTLIVVPPHIPGGLLLEQALSHLAATLRQHNEQAPDPMRMQLRVALHAGPVIADPQGMTGNAINHTARLVQAKILGKQLTQTQADLGIIVSAFFYDNVIKQHDGQPPASARYQQIRFQDKEHMLTAWTHLIGAQVSVTTSLTSLLGTEKGGIQ